MSNELNIKNGFISNDNSIVRGNLTVTSISSTTITTSFSSGSTLFAGTSGQISQNNSQFFWDNVNNRLGIGTASPLSVLHVKSSIINGVGTEAIRAYGASNYIGLSYDEGRGPVFVTSYVNTGGSSPGSFNFYTDAGTRLASIGTGGIFSNNVNGKISNNNQNGSINLWNGTSGNMELLLTTNHNMTFTTNNTEKARITNTGNFLINTTTDAGYKLDINGTVRFKAQGALYTDIAFRVRNSADTLDIIKANGAGDVFIGLAAGLNNTTGTNNTFIGIEAGRNNITSTSNTFIGAQAGINTTADSNTFVGATAGRDNISGGSNSFFGLQAGFFNTIGSSNVSIGRDAGLNNTTGGSNSFIGTSAGRYQSDGTTSLTIANNSVFIGFDSRANANSQTNQIVIGHTAIGIGSNSVVLGNDSITKTALKGNVLINTTTDAGYKLDVSGGTRVVGTKGSIITSGSSSTAFITVSGSSTVGGTGYTDFIQVTNTAAGATNINKTIRVNNTGAIEFINSAYNATIFSVTDVGAVGVGLATTTSSDATSNYLSFGNNNTQIYDDGNTHIHSRGANQAMWINTNGGQLNLLTQSPTATGGIGSGIAIATGTLNGYVTINTGRTVTTSAAYGYLTTGGAGTYPGGSQSVVISLYANSRIWGQEIDAFSDERMKDIEGDITLEDGLKLVNNLKPIKYRWKESDDKGLKAGYSAQQVIKSGFDHLVSIIPNEGLEETIDSDGFMSPKDTQFSMNYDQVTPYHGVVIKHLLEEIKTLKQEINKLKNNNN